VDWLNPDPDMKNESVSFGVDYDYSCNTNDPYKIRMVMRLVMSPNSEDDASACPYEIFSEIEGYFKFSDDIEAEKMPFFSRVNSLTILYGILRGEIANITGSFKGQKYILPSIMMQDVVNDTEARKKAEEEEFAGDAE